MKTSRRRRYTEWLVTLPSLAWLVVLFVLPTLIVFAIAFKPANPYGGIGAGWTWSTLASLGNPNYPAIIWRTLWISTTTTVLCLLLGIPMAYFMAQLPPRRRQVFLLLVIIPFWTSFLVRIFAWKVLLHPDGLIKQALVALHLVDADASLLYNAGAVLLVMVYTYLPFAVLPIYAAAEKFEFALIEAARDLGASSWKAFRSIFLPGIRRGILTAFLMVFIPALGAYVIPDIVGGPHSEMIGNKIAQRTFVDRNLPHASALSVILTLAVLAPLTAGMLMQRKKDRHAVLHQEGL
ncbi:MAG: ABC transporter permease [Spartobacteria bacterium]|nr:ABC transporter permease [Spartobacteria bacterium]